MKVTFHPEARQEFLDAVRHYNEQVRDLGGEFIQAVADSIERIRNFPESYPYVVAHYRRAGVRKFPYGIVYQFGADGLTLVAVMHNRRSPEYFLDRMR